MRLSRPWTCPFSSWFARCRPQKRPKRGCRLRGCTWRREHAFSYSSSPNLSLRSVLKRILSKRSPWIRWSWDRISFVVHEDRTDFAGSGLCRDRGKNLVPKKRIQRRTAQCNLTVQGSARLCILFSSKKRMSFAKLTANWNSKWTGGHPCA